MTSAPMSPIMAVDTGPICHIVQSRTLIPFSGPFTSFATNGIPPKLAMDSVSLRFG